MNKKIPLKILILGDSGTGKTSILARYLNKVFVNKFVSTIGADFYMKDLTIGDKPVIMQIWDTAGQERFQTFSNAYYRGTDACILVFDITDINSFNNMGSWKRSFIDRVDDFQDLDDFPFIVIGNKSDLQLQRKVSNRSAKQWADNNKMEFFETSAKDDLNIDLIFKKIAEKVIQNKNIDIKSELLDKESSVDLYLSPKKNNMCC